jgi:hypothetical protein
VERHSDNTHAVADAVVAQPIASLRLGRLVELAPFDLDDEELPAGQKPCEVHSSDELVRWCDEFELGDVGTNARIDEVKEGTGFERRLQPGIS